VLGTVLIERTESEDKTQEQENNRYR